MTAETACDICGDPADPSAYGCRRCASSTAQRLRDVVDLAGEVETTVARLARYAARGGRRAPEVEESGPKSTGGLRPTPLPVDLNASARAAVAFCAVTTWARHCADERGADIPTPAGTHPAAAGAAFLIGQLDWLRFRQEAAEAFDELSAAGSAIRRIVDAPPELEIVGACDCDAYLYARKGAATVACPDCGARWDVQASRDGLRRALRDRCVTAAEAATLLAFFGLTGDRTRSRKTIVMWAQRGVLVAHGEVNGGPAYLFGDVIDRATRSAQGLPVA